MPRDHQLLIGWNDVQRNAASLFRDQALSCRIGRRIKPCTKPVELLRDSGPHHDGVFANTCRKHKRVESSERGSQHSDTPPNMVYEVVDREGRARILAVGKLAHVVADPGETLEPTLPIKEVRDFCVGHVLL